MSVPPHALHTLPSVSDPTQLLERAWQVADQHSSQGVVEYLNHVVIDSKPEPRAFRLVAEDWQWALAGLLKDAIQSVARVGGASSLDYHGPRNFWITMPKGHDKTSLLGRLLNWALAYARGSLNAYAAAFDKEQAALLSEAMSAEAALNPWLARRLKFGNWKVEGTTNKAVLKILATEASSSQGLRPDFLLVDEVTLWKDEQFLHNLLSGKTKRFGMVTVVITNAGYLHTWQHKLLQEAKRQKKQWLVYEAPHQLASWMNLEDIAETRKMIPPGEARRLYDNQWIDPAEGAGFVTRQEVQACEDYGAELGLLCRSQGEIGKSYVASVDYGPVRDRTVMAVMHHDKDKDIVVVDRMDVLQGSKFRHVPVEDVEQWIKQISRYFTLDALVIDPYQMESTIQNFQSKLVVERFEPRGGKANYELAQTIRSLIINKKVAWYPGCGDIILSGGKGIHTIADEFVELILKHLAYGYRIDHLPGHHDDRVVCLGMGALAALRSTPKRPLLEAEWYW